MFFNARYRMYAFRPTDRAISGRRSARPGRTRKSDRLSAISDLWTYNGEDKTPGTGGSVTCTTTRRWISGGYFVESHRTCDTPRGTFEQVEMSWV